MNVAFPTSSTGFRSPCRALLGALAVLLVLPALSAADQPEPSAIWTYQPDRKKRDPFAVGRAPTTKVDPGTRPPPGAVAMDVIEKCCQDTEAALKREQYPAALTECDKGVKKIEEEMPKAQDAKTVAGILKLRDRFYLLRRMAERLQSRAEAQAKLKSLNLAVSAVMIQDRKAQAMINGEWAGKAGVLRLGPRGEEALTVVDIFRDHIVVDFRGYWFEVLVGATAALETAR
jgi:hypothetical protein